MARFFNIAGPCNPADHYMLPPERRLRELSQLVQEKLYFVLHAPRQAGKTTAMIAYVETLRKQGYRALYASLETARGVEETNEAEPIWLVALSRAVHDSLPPEGQPPPIGPFLADPSGTRLGSWLAAWARAAETPLVLILDEVDGLQGEALVSFLSQLRAGYTYRPRAFPVSVGLVGMRDLRDYLTRAKAGQAINANSPFNIKAESLTLRNFTAPEVAELYAQHTADTGQVFSSAASERVFYWTQGQPFLVNALARTIVNKLCPDGETIEAAHVDAAKELLILSRTTHLDNLAQRLQEHRVGKVVRTVLLGEGGVDWRSDDVLYCQDLGLLKKGPDGLEAANPLYREVLIRELTQNVQENLSRPWWPWQTSEGRLDFPALIAAFLAWWRQHGDLLLDRNEEPWKEVTAHLAFLGFLQRVVNGGGDVHREYASGRGRMDVRVDYARERFVVELKRVAPLHVSFDTVREEGIEQLSGYLDSQGCAEGWLLIFDQREGRTWDQRLWTEELEVRGRRLHLRGG